MAWALATVFAAITAFVPDLGLPLGAAVVLLFKGAFAGGFALAGACTWGLALAGSLLTTAQLGGSVSDGLSGAANACPVK